MLVILTLWELPERHAMQIMHIGDSPVQCWVAITWWNEVLVYVDACDCTTV